MLKPINDYILIQKTDGEAEKTESGIFIAKTEHQMEEYHVGIVKEITATKNHYGKMLHTDDKVVYKHYRNIMYKGFEVIKFDDIILIDKDDERAGKNK